MKKLLFIILSCYAEKYDYSSDSKPQKSCFKNVNSEKSLKHVHFQFKQFVYASDSDPDYIFIIGKDKLDTPPRNIFLVMN